MNEGCRVRVTGPLAGYVDGFRDELAAQGYTVQVRDRQLRMLAHVSRWMAGQGLSVAELTPDLLEDFLDERRREGYHHALSRRAVMPLMEHVRALATAPCPSAADPAGVLNPVMADFRRYLLCERALTPVVADKYMRLARAFLTATVQAGAPVGELSAAVVTGYVVRECNARPPGSAKYLVTVLRSVLGFLFLAGHISEPLAFAVPTVAHWRAGSLPRALSPDAVTALTGGCDSATLGGLRDRAIVVLLARLGLRAGEVAALELGDLDWRAGELVVRTCKTARRERLPLPVDVGEALAAYLQSRPRAACRKVFLRLNAPITGLTTPAVTSVVYRACRRAGQPRAGAHRLRHSAASAMLAGGASLTEIGQVLRHARQETTAIYAKVDTTALGALARPWPGDAA
jgi:site-specific recombinase XerD